MALLVAGMWLLEGVDQASGNALDAYGIRPRTGEGVVGVFIAPWLHGGWAHLVSNTIPFFVLGVLVLLEGWGQWFRTTLVVVLVSGAAVWLLAPAGSITLGRQRRRVRLARPTWWPAASTPAAPVRSPSGS